ncbi:hypothetical protein HKD37_06G016793 [Glycine soja]
MPTHQPEATKENSSHDTNRQDDTIGRSHQRSQSEQVGIHCQHPFINCILDAPFSLRWKPLNIKRYDETTYLDEHLEAYITQALTWWHQLLARSIDMFATLVEHFGAQYATCRPHEK